jgi:hypothetical protein
MIEVEASPGATPAVHGADETVRMPPQPKTVRETGLEQALIVELVAKAMYATGKMHLPVLTGKLRLSINVLREVLGFMLAEHLSMCCAKCSASCWPSSWSRWPRAAIPTWT